MGVNVSARFGKNDELYNGLNHQEEDLLDDPGTLRVAVIKYRTKFAKEDFEHGGARTPTVKIEHIEPLYEEAARDASNLAQAAYKARTGGDLAARPAEMTREQAAEFIWHWADDAARYMSPDAIAKDPALLASAYRWAAKRAHPDRTGDDGDTMARLNQARDLLTGSRT